MGTVHSRSSWPIGSSSGRLVTSPEVFETVLGDSHGVNLLNVCLKGGSDPSRPVGSRCRSPLFLALNSVPEACSEAEDELLERVIILLRHGSIVGLVELSQILRNETYWQKILNQVLLLPHCLANPLQEYIHDIQESVRSGNAESLHEIILEVLGTMRKRDPAFRMSQDACHFLYVRSFGSRSTVQVARAVFEKGNHIDSIVDWEWVNAIRPLVSKKAKVMPLHLLLVSQRCNNDRGDLCHLRRLETLRVLVGAGSDVNRICIDLINEFDEHTPLALACQWGCYDEVRCLIEAGANLNAPAPATSFGRTALQLAAEAGDLETVEYLIAKGADVNAVAGPNRGATALQCAAAQGHFHIMQVLLEAGADIDAPGSNIQGRKAVEIAAENGRLDCLYHLLDKYNGQTPISEVCEEAADYARVEGHHVIADFLDRYPFEKVTAQLSERERTL